MNIYEKLIEVRKVVTYLQKENEGQQYNYVSSSQVLSKVRTKMDELGLLIIPAIVGHRLNESTIEYIEKGKYGDKPKKTTTYFTELDMVMKWVNAENSEEFIDVPWYGQGVDIAGEKGVGKALTYAEKYFLLKSFNIATDKDDPDAFQEKHNDDKPDQQKNDNPQSGKPEQHSDKSLQQPVYKCVNTKCNKSITKTVHDYSVKHYGKGYCQECQNKIKAQAAEKAAQAAAQAAQAQPAS